jgi:hypothetical protein
MVWGKKSSNRPYRHDVLDAKEIIYDAYREGFINWNVYQKAVDRIKSNRNGTWMFEKGSLRTEFDR